MVGKKAGAAQSEQPRDRIKSRGSLARTRRGSKIGLVLITWAVLLGWIGICSYNVIKQQYLSVYAQDQGTDGPRGIPEGERAGTGTHDQPTAGPGANTSVGVLLSSGLVLFSVATGIRLLMSRRTENNT
jgi:hypothetical protein